MTVTFTPPDNEFAASSGSNVNYDQSYSYFDHPPNSTSNLVITSNDGDPDPYMFELGETYDLTWQGNGGGGNMQDATIIRSDDWGNGQGVIVFEGINSVTGELFQMVYTPNFDLEEWYWSNGGGPSSPNGFWTSDQNASTYSAPVCYAPGTLIACAEGPRPVERLRVGDRVRTLDHGWSPIRWVHSSQQCLEGADKDQFPIRIAANAIGPNLPSRDLLVSPQHRILVGGCGQLPDQFATECLVPAKALTALPGISVVRNLDAIVWTHFALDRHEVVAANDLLSESLLLGAMAVSALPLLTKLHLWTLFGVSPDGEEPLNGPPARPFLGAGKVKRHLRDLQGRRQACDRDGACDLRTTLVQV